MLNSPQADSLIRYDFNRLPYLALARDRNGKPIYDQINGAYEIIAVRQLESVPSDFPLR